MTPLPPLSSERHAPPTPSRAPRYSIIVPTHNREVGVRRALDAIEALDYDRSEYEVIVVDDGSGDDTAALLARRERPGFRAVIRVRGGVAAARNAGIALARGEFLAFTDDDCAVPPQWLRSFDRRFAEPGADVIGGSVDNALPALLSRYYQEMATQLYERQNVAARSPEFLTANNLACRRSLLERHGAFDPRFFLGGEDRELVRRLAARGARVMHAPEIRVRHYHAFTIASFVGHHYRLGCGSYLLHRLPADSERWSSVRPGHGVYADFILDMLRRPPAREAPLRLALFVLAQAGVTAGFLAAWARRAERGPSAVESRDD